MFTTILYVCILSTVLRFGITGNIPLHGSCKIKNYDTEGECIKFRSCPHAMQLLNLKDIESLRNMACGFEGRDVKVCCPNNVNSTEGHITFKNTTEQVINYTEVPSVSNSTVKHPRSTTRRITTTSIAKEQLESNRNVVTNEDRFQDAEIKPIITNWRLKPLINKQTSSTISSIHNSTRKNTFWSPMLPSRGECGLPALDNRIVGGTITAVDEFPWLARIKYNLGSSKDYACAGSLITDRHIVTAAHCVVMKHRNHALLNIRLGEWDETVEKDCYEGVCNGPTVDRKISQIYVHPEHTTDLKADIAILKISEPVNYTDYIRPICLPTTEYIINQDYIPETTYYVAGWGKTEYEFKSSIKRKVALPSVPMDICRAALKVITDDMAPNIICAGGRSSKDTCQGDSGSSLVRQVSEDFNQNYFLYGITSFGSSCGVEGKPSVYTRIVPYMKWILETIEL